MKTGFKHSEETKNKLRLLSLGRKPSDETRKKMSDARKGCIPWNKGKTGLLSSETRAKIGKFHLGKHRSDETKLKISIANKGRKLSPEHYEKFTKCNKNKPWSEARRKAQEFVVKKVREFSNKIGGEEFYSDDWIKIRTEIYERDNWSCRICGIHCHGNGKKDKIQCHHIDYDKKNCELTNLITLCASCHMKTNFNRQDWKTILIIRKEIKLL